MSKLFVEFSLVTGCVNDCKYCPQESHLKAYKGKKLLSMEDYIIMIDKLPKSTISIAGFSEPYMNPKCSEMIDYATKKGHNVILYTTLKGMTIEHYNLLKKNYGVRSIMVHLPDREGNSKIKIDEDYKKLLKHIVIYGAGAWCGLDFSVHGSKVHDDIINIININPVYRIHDRAGTLITDDTTVHKVHWKSGAIRCGNGFGNPESGLVLPDGTVLSCCMDWNVEYIYGNLLNQSWQEVMQSPIRKVLSDDRKTACHNTLCRSCAEACMDYIRG